MRRALVTRTLSATLIAAASIGLMPPLQRGIAAENKVSQTEYTVHEWGTFTSIADDGGMALEWQPFGGPSDLPCFVHRFQIGFKASPGGTGPVETAVLC